MNTYNDVGPQNSYMWNGMYRYIHLLPTKLVMVLFVQFHLVVTSQRMWILTQYDTQQQHKISHALSVLYADINRYKLYPYHCFISCFHFWRVWINNIRLCQVSVSTCIYYIGSETIWWQHILIHTWSNTNYLRRS